MISKINDKNDSVDLQIDEDVKQVLLGSLMGDGSLGKNKGAKNVFYREIHSSKQKEYLLWKNQFLKVFNTRYYEYSTYDNRTNKTYHSILLWSRVSSLLTYYHDLLYKNGKKSFPIEFLQEVNIFGLAVWYMDDGYYHYGDDRCGLSTDALSFEDHVILTKWLKDKFDIDSRFYNRGKKGTTWYTLVFSKSEANKFLKLIEPYVIPSMYYKLGAIKEENQARIKEFEQKGIEYRKTFYNENKELMQKKNKINYYKNRNNWLIHRKQYYELNREKILAQKKGYHIKNRDLILNKNRLYQQQNVEKLKKAGRLYYIRNKDKILKRDKAYREANKEAISKRRKERYYKHKELMKI